MIPHGQFHCGNRGYTQNTDFPWAKSHFPVGKRSSGTATNNYVSETEREVIEKCRVVNFMTTAGCVK